MAHIINIYRLRSLRYPLLPPAASPKDTGFPGVMCCADVLIVQNIPNGTGMTLSNWMVGHTRTLTLLTTSAMCRGWELLSASQGWGSVGGGQIPVAICVVEFPWHLHWFSSLTEICRWPILLCSSRSWLGRFSLGSWHKSYSKSYWIKVNLLYSFSEFCNWAFLLEVYNWNHTLQSFLMHVPKPEHFRQVTHNEISL